MQRMKEKLVFSNTNKAIVDQICLVLKDNNISFTKKMEGTGDYLAIVAGNTFNNEIQIFVSDENYKKAIELINVFNQANESTLVKDTPDELKDISPDEEKEMEEMANKTKGYLKSFIKYFVFFPILFVIAMLIITDIIPNLGK